MGCIQILDEIIDIIYEKLKISSVVKIFLGKKRERPQSKTKNNKLLFKRIPKKNKDNNKKRRLRKKCNNNSHKKETKIKKDDNSKDVNVEKKEYAIVNYLRNIDTHRMYSYKFLSNKFSFTYKKGNGNEYSFSIYLKNDGKIQWPENSYLKLINKNCNEVEINDVELGALDIDETKIFEIKFDNLKKCNEGEYKALFGVFINDKKIGQEILIRFTVK